MLVGAGENSEQVARAFWPSEPDLKAGAGTGLIWVVAVFLVGSIGLTQYEQEASVLGAFRNDPATRREFLSMVGDPAARFREDYLRILRAIRRSRPIPPRPMTVRLTT